MESKKEKECNEMTLLSVIDQGHTARGGREELPTLSVVVRGQFHSPKPIVTFPSTRDALVTASYKNNLTLPLGDNDFPSLQDKYPVSNLGVAERQSGCQAGHLAD